MSDILNIPELGELEIVEVYDYFNVPILFSCRNSVSHLYIVIFADHSPEYETWLSEYVTPDQLHSDVFPPVNEYLNLEDIPLFPETNLVVCQP